MKHLLLPLLLMIISIVSCTRELDDAKTLSARADQVQKDKDTCVVLAQSGAYIPEEPRSSVFGFRKVVNPETGRVGSIRSSPLPAARSKSIRSSIISSIWTITLCMWMV
jgi:hypothetical protein